MPRLLCPFADDEVIEPFTEAIAAAREEDYIPPEYGVLETDQNYCSWDPHITIEVARKAEKILLPTVVWEPRARQWVRGLHFMTAVTIDVE